MTVEGNRLAWIRENQRSIGAETYQGLTDFVNNRRAQAEQVEEGIIEQPVTFNDQRVVTRIILPSTYIGSERYMQQNIR